MGVMDKVCITFFEGDVITIPLTLLRRPLGPDMNISERSRLCFPDLSFLGPVRFSVKMGLAEYGPNLMRRFYLWHIVLWFRPSSTNIILKVPTADELFNFIFQHDTLLYSVTNILVVSAVLILVSFLAVSMQWVRSLENPGLFCFHETSSREETRSV